MAIPGIDGEGVGVADGFHGVQIPAPRRRMQLGFATAAAPLLLPSRWLPHSSFAHPQTPLPNQTSLHIQRERRRREREMGVKVYGAAMSTCTARVAISLLEVGAEYELVPVNLAIGEHKSPAHLDRNPFGQIPALEDDHVKLFESRAIARYVLRKYKSASAPDLLREGNPAESAAVDVWLEVEAHQYTPAITPIFVEYIVKPVFYGGAPDESAVAAAAEKFAKVLDVYEARLSKSKYLAGDFVSMADLSHVPHTAYIMSTPCASLVESRPHVKAWWEDISSRPAVKKATAGFILGLKK